MPGSRQPDPYTVLNVARSATGREIRAAYRALVQKYHPDRHQGNPLEDLASDRLAEINRAYETLSDAKLRAAHDAGSYDVASGAPAGVQKRPAATDGRMVKRLIGGALFLLLLPFNVRIVAAVVRALAGLTRGLFEATASLRGGRLAAAAVLALGILTVTLVRRRRGSSRQRPKSRPS